MHEKAGKAGTGWHVACHLRAKIEPTMKWNVRGPRKIYCGVLVNVPCHLSVPMFKQRCSAGSTNTPFMHVKQSTALIRGATTSTNSDMPDDSNSAPIRIQNMAIKDGRGSLCLAL